MSSNFLSQRCSWWSEHWRGASMLLTWLSFEMVRIAISVCLAWRSLRMSFCFGTALLHTSQMNTVCSDSNLSLVYSFGFGCGQLHGAHCIREFSPSMILGFSSSRRWLRVFPFDCLELTIFWSITVNFCLHWCDRGGIIRALPSSLARESLWLFKFDHDFIARVTAIKTVFCSSEMLVMMFLLAWRILKAFIGFVYPILQVKVLVYLFFKVWYQNMLSISSAMGKQSIR